MTPAQRLRRLEAAGDDGEAADRAVGGAWLITFTDLVSLVLGFFVLLYAMQDHAPLQPAAPAPPPAGHEVLPPGLEAPLSLDYLQAVVAQRLAEAPQLAGTVLSRRGERLVLHLPADLLFADGSDALRPEGRSLVTALVPLLASLPQGVEVLGHSDPRLYTGSVFLNNRDLSLARALAVADVLEAAGRGGGVSAQGFGADRLDEAAELAELPADAATAPDKLGEAEQQRLYRLARRVDIAILAARPVESPDSAPPADDR